MLKACGYCALKRKHRTSLRPELPDLKVKQVAPTSDRIVYWSRVVEIQDRLAEGLFVPDGDLSFLKKTMEGPVMRHAVDWLLQIRSFGDGLLCAADVVRLASYDSMQAR